jgi:hypothetical protein
MARTKKKRNKRYTGQGAAVTGPVVHRYEAVERSPLNQWFVEHKTRVRIIGIIAASAGALALLIDGIATIIH